LLKSMLKRNQKIVTPLTLLLDRSFGFSDLSECIDPIANNFHNDVCNSFITLSKSDKLKRTPKFLI
jgi:hypothetical protein